MPWPRTRRVPQPPKETAGTRRRRCSVPAWIDTSSPPAKRALPEAYPGVELTGAIFRRLMVLVRRQCAQRAWKADNGFGVPLEEVAEVVKRRLRY